MKEIKAFIRKNMIDRVVDALESLDDAPGITLTDVRGWGHPKEGPAQLVQRIKLETVVPSSRVDEIISAIVENGKTSHYGDGKVFVSDVEKAVRIRTGETGEDVIR